LISHDWPEFQIKKINQQYHTKNKGYIKSFIFHDKLDGHTKVIVISVFQNAVLFMDFQMGFKDFQMFKSSKIINNVCLISSPKRGLG
jgi:heme-degrading monooxygenase HmoA